MRPIVECIDSLTVFDGTESIQTASKHPSTSVFDEYGAPARGARECRRWCVRSAAAACRLPGCMATIMIAMQQSRHVAAQ